MRRRGRKEEQSDVTPASPRLAAKAVPTKSRKRKADDSYKISDYISEEVTIILFA